MEDYINIAAKHSGLTDSVAAERREMYGANSETGDDGERKPLFPTAWAFRSLRFWLMLSASFLLICDLQIAKGIIMVLLTALYAGTEVVKRKKCGKSAEYFHHRDGFEVAVVRGGKPVMLDSRQLVPDDIVFLTSGDSVPADLHILESEGVTADESVFTGNNDPIGKQAGVDSKNELKQSCVYKGTRILTGTLVGRVVATGVDTYRYKTLGDTSNFQSSSFEQIIAKISPVFSFASALLLVVTALLAFNTYGDGEISKVLAGTLLPAISFALCFIPAEMICIIRLFHLSAAGRLKKRQTVIRNLSVLETLNAMTSLCVDKSGFIEVNRISVDEEYSQNVGILTNISVLSCESSGGSEFDGAITFNAVQRQVDVKELLENKLIKTYPCAPGDNMSGNLWDVNGVRLLCIKGLPEKVYTVCSIQHDELYAFQERQSQYSKQGRQALCVAYAKIEENEVPNSIYDVEFKAVGLISFNSRIRDSVPAAVRNFYKAGVNIIMFTGDSAEIAGAIGAKIGLAEKGIMTGERLKNAMVGGEMPVKDINIYSEITGEQRNAIVKMLKQSGEIVGVISGGAEADAGLFELSDIGLLTPGDSGTGIRQAGDILLPDDDLGNFVDIIRETRQTHSSIKGAVGLGACATAVLILFSVINFIFGKGLIFDEIISSLILIGLVPLCLFSYINNRGEMKQSQSPSGFIGKGKVDPDFFKKIIWQSVSLLVIILSAFYITIEFPLSYARSVIFITFVSGLVSMQWVNMSDSVSAFRLISRNEGGALLYTGIIILISLILIYLPFLNIWVGFSAVNPLLILLASVGGIASQLWYELIKRKKRLYNQSV
ncbi:MAG: cation-translocating P-type ATPase [Eubacterium sp.]|nr:cation-translocating P-type ATPase [Eubacterium sp.]